MEAVCDPTNVASNRPHLPLRWSKRQSRISCVVGDSSNSQRRTNSIRTTPPSISAETGTRWRARAAVSPIIPLLLLLLVLLQFLLQSLCTGAEARLAPRRAPLKTPPAKHAHQRQELLRLPLSSPSQLRLLQRLDDSQGDKGASTPAAPAVAAAHNRPCFVLFNGDASGLDPEILLHPHEAAKTAAANASGIAQSAFRVFSFWHHTGGPHPGQQTPESSPAPHASGELTEHSQTPTKTATVAAAEKAPIAADEKEPIVLHLPAVPGGWNRQTDAEALERTAIAGAAAACGDLLLLPLSLGDLEGPRSLLPQQQPLPLLFNALQLQLQLRTLQQQKQQQKGLPATSLSIAAAANRTKPLVLLLSDPFHIDHTPQRMSNEDTAIPPTAATADAALEALRVAAAHAALRLLETEWRAAARELGVDEPANHHNHQQLPAEGMPALRSLFSVHVVFLPRLKTAHGPSRPSLAALTPEGKTNLQLQLNSLLALHRAREALRPKETDQSQHRQQQQGEAGREGAGGSSNSALPLFEEATAACRAMLAAPEVSSSSPVLEETPGAAAQGPLTASAALEFDAEMYRRELLAKFRAELGEVEGPQEGFVVLQRLLAEFDAKCKMSAKENVAMSRREKKTDEESALNAAVADIRQALEREAFKELRLLHRLQLEALRVLSARRFELLVQQLLAGRADQQEQLQETQQLNLYDIANRISYAALQTANNLQQFIRDHHRSMDLELARHLLLEEPESSLQHQEQQPQAAAAAREYLGAVERLAAQERRLLLKSLREIAAAALHQQELLQLQQQRQAGLGPLHRLQRKAVNRFLATAPGRVALRGLRRVSSAASAAAAHVGELPLLRQLLQSPLAGLWSNRRPIDVSFHYLSPTAFGLSPVRNTVTLNEPWRGKLHLQQLACWTDTELLPHEKLLPPSASAADLRQLKEALAVNPPGSG